MSQEKQMALFQHRFSLMADLTFPLQTRWLLEKKEGTSELETSTEDAGLERAFVL